MSFSNVRTGIAEPYIHEAKVQVSETCFLGRERVGILTCPYIFVQERVGWAKHLDIFMRERVVWAKHLDIFVRERFDFLRYPYILVQERLATRNVRLRSGFQRQQT